MTSGAIALADSPYVAQMTAAILCVNRDANTIDITHSIPPQDMREGSLALADAAFQFPAGTHLAVVDPVVGTERGSVAARLDGHWFIAPDNGLLSGVVEAASETQFWSVAIPELWRKNVSRTFHGRDSMAPVAAHLNRGVDATDIDSPLNEIVSLPRSQPTCSDKEIQGEVISIDSFGNCLTNISAEMIAAQAGELLTVQCGENVICGLSQTYGDRPVGSPATLVGSAGRLEIAVVGGNAARELIISRGTAVVVRRASSP